MANQQELAMAGPYRTGVALALLAVAPVPRRYERAGA